MIITTDKPYTKHEIANLQEVFGSYIKTVIDLDKLSDFNLSNKISTSLDSEDERSAEDLLMYSTLVRNCSLNQRYSILPT